MTIARDTNGHLNCRMILAAVGFVRANALSNHQMGVNRLLN